MDIELHILRDMHDHNKILRCAVSISLHCESLNWIAGNIGSVFAYANILRYNVVNIPPYLNTTYMNI